MLNKKPYLEDIWVGAVNQLLKKESNPSGGILRITLETRYPNRGYHSSTIINQEVTDGATRLPFHRGQSRPKFYRLSHTNQKKRSWRKGAKCCLLTSNPVSNGQISAELWTACCCMVIVTDRRF